MRRVLSLLFLFFIQAACAADFEMLLGKGSHFWRKLSDYDKQEIRFYQELYTKYYPLLSLKQETKIPKVLHVIWVGPKPFPATSIPFIQSWKDAHPQWTFKFWTDSEERSCPLDGMEKHLISEIPFQKLGIYLDKTNNYAERADLIRYEILFLEGGVYIDHDMECFHSFDALNESYTFYACLEPPHRIRGFDTRLFASNGLFAAVSRHPILAAAIETVAKRWDPIEKEFAGEDPKIRFLKVMNRTFYSFATAVRSHLNEPGYTDIVLPSSFFFSDPIFSPEKIEQLKNEHLILASHKFAGTWVEHKEEKSPKKQKALEKKLHKAALVTIANGCLTLLLLVGLLWVHKKGRYAKKN